MKDTVSTARYRGIHLEGLRKAGYLVFSRESK
jgi:hypothetical protein